MEQRPKNGLGIVGFIIGIISIILSCIVIGGFTGAIGIIICTIALNKKEKRDKITIIGLILNIAAFLFTVFMLIFIISSNTEIEYEDDSYPTENTSVSVTVKENDTDDGIINATASNCTLKYLRHEIAENALGDECVAVYYLFTNNSKEATSYIYTFSDQAFQNGIELEKSLFLLDDVEDNRSKDIKPGISIEVYSLYKHQDNSIIELEVSPWISFSNKPIDIMELSLE